MKSLTSPLGVISYLAVSQAFGAINVVSDTDTGGWVAISGNYDYLSDQQTGQPSSDIVGGSGGSYNAYDAGFFTHWDPGTASSTDGTLGFRVRLDDHDGNNTPAYNGFLWVGIDADTNGSIDAFIGVDKQGNSSKISIYDAGSDPNISPSTTSIAKTAYYSTDAISGTNYSYREVNFANDGGTTNDITTSTSGDTDYYISFTVDFGRLVTFLNTQGISANDSTPMRYIVATATQGQSLNQDLGQLPKNFDGTQTWEQLGGFSPTMTATGTVVPEPSTMLLGVTALPFLFRRRRQA
jgi:hypothetical protein